MSKQTPAQKTSHPHIQDTDNDAGSCSEWKPGEAEGLPELTAQRTRSKFFDANASDLFLSTCNSANMGSIDAEVKARVRGESDMKNYETSL